MAATNDQHEKMLKKIRDDAHQAFGKEGAEDWLAQRWRVFDDKTPIEMAKSDPQRVKWFIDCLNGKIRTKGATL